jgi:membrane protein DedA with SNARE-associated domain
MRFFLLATFFNRVFDWVGTGGYAVLFAVLFGCGMGFPLPEDIPLLIAGFFVAQGKMNLWLAAGAAWVGIIGGDCVLYHLGRKFGLNITKVPVIGKHVTAKRIEWAETLFERYGIWVVAIGRMFAGVRGAMVIAAGTIRYSFVKFVIADGLAAIVSGGLFVALGYWAGVAIGDLNDPRVQQRISEAKHYLLGGAIVLGVLLIAYFWWRHKKHKSLAEAMVDKVIESPPDQQVP